MSEPEQDLSTPIKVPNPFEDLHPKGSRKRKQVDFSSPSIKTNIENQHASASPSFKKTRDAGPEMPACRSPPTTGKLAQPPQPMDTGIPTSQAPAALGLPQPALIDPGFLTSIDKKIDLLTSGMMAISSKVDDQSKKLAENTAEISRQAVSIATNADSIAEIFRRLDEMKGVGQADRTPTSAPRTRSQGSADFKWARRSIRMWPVCGSRGDEVLWAAVGDFLQDKLLLTDDLIKQTDIESIRVAENPIAAANVFVEVIVTFYNIEKRDLVMRNATNLAGQVDSNGAPSAGLRLEVPPELVDTFRLLSRFGTRLRARHWEGTKRHIKFDDFGAGLYAVVKLPGDDHWTRVTPAMAERDLEASFRQEEEANQKRLAAKLLPGPRERLSRPLQSTASSQRMLAPPTAGLQEQVAAQRPRKKWGAPRS